MARVLIRRPMDIDEARQTMRLLFNPTIAMPDQERYELIRAAYEFDRVWYAIKFGPEEVDRQWAAVEQELRKHREKCAMLGWCIRCMAAIKDREIPSLPDSIKEAKADGRFPRDGLCDRCIFGAAYD